MTNPQQPNAPVSFPLFTHLPKELRLLIYSHILALTHTSHSNTRILKLSFSSSPSRFISNTPPPVTLSISGESRIYTLQTHTNLSLGPSPPPSSISPSPLIPLDFSTTTLYLSSLSPLLSTHIHSILFQLSTSSCRHAIRSLAVDFRVWAELCENGFLGVVARMRALREVVLVVEFGRCFEGEVGFLEVPGWRRDLCWVAEAAEKRVGEERARVSGIGKGQGREGEGKLGLLSVRCVLLTRGGEQS